MAGVSVKVDAEGVRKLLNRALDSTHNLSMPMRLIGALLVKSTQDNFQAGTAPDGTPWPPSARARKEGGKTLIKTGRLLASVNYQATAQSVEVGSNAIYAAIHQLGGEIKRKPGVLAHRGPKDNRFLSRKKAMLRARAVRVSFHGAYVITMPARPYLGVKEKDWGKIRDILLAEILGGGK